MEIIKELRSIVVEDGGVLEAFIELYEKCVDNPLEIDEYGDNLMDISKDLSLMDGDEQIVKRALDDWMLRRSNR